MTDKILVVTPPDDILLSGIRILHFELTQEQSKIVSDALLASETKSTIINYIWKNGSPIDWYLDKVIKSDLIIFNADASFGTETLIGWTAAQPNSYYFGNLKDLQKANDRAIYSSTELVDIIQQQDRERI